MNSHTAALLAAAAALLAAARGAAQEEAALLAAFDAAAAEYSAARGESRQALAAAASSAFLRLPDGEGRARRLALGAEATLEAGRVELALRLSVAPKTGDDAGPLLVVQLRALARAGRLPELFRLVEAHEQRLPAAVAAALQAEEGRLLPLAASALRGPDRPAARGVFERLASLEPFASYRIANLGLCLRQIGDVDAAEEAYRRGLAQAPRDIELWNDFGLLLRAQGRRSEALAAFAESVRLDLARSEQDRAKGPAITNLLHMEALAPGAAGQDPLPTALRALSQRPDAVMLRRLTLDVVLDRAAAVGRR